MQKIIPHLWYDKEAGAAADFYVSAFGGNSKVTLRTNVENTPSGTAEIVHFSILGYEFQAISAGPLFKFNPSVSISVAFKTGEEVDAAWNRLVDGGTVLMELGSYPYSERYGWLQDRYGLTWQLIAVTNAPIPQPVYPALMYTEGVCGKAEEAINFYVDTFRNNPTKSPESTVGDLFRYQKGQEPDKEGTLAHGVFFLDGEEFIAFDSARRHGFTFNEAVSLIVSCKTQEEVDYFWGRLSADPKAEQCGWLKDKYGVSWQIVPDRLGELMSSGDREKTNRVTQAFLKMKKFDIAELERAANG